MVVADAGRASLRLDISNKSRPPHEHRTSAAISSVAAKLIFHRHPQSNVIAKHRTPSMLASRRGTLRGLTYSLFSFAYNNLTVIKSKIL
jgi:hypothetical protein